MDIKICNHCKGTGELREDIGTHESEYVNYVCSMCNGTGRVKTRTYSYSVPYDLEDSIINKADSKIIEIIRELQKEHLRKVKIERVVGK